MTTYVAGQSHPAGPLPKDPDATVPFTFNWSAWLGDSAEISSVAWDVPAGLTQESASSTATTATVYLSGGTAGSTYTVRCRVTTNESPARVDDRSLLVRVVER